MNYLKEFVNEDGYNMNKMEGYWWYMKVSLFVFGICKDKYFLYFVEFIW